MEPAFKVPGLVLLWQASHPALMNDCATNSLSHLPDTHHTDYIDICNFFSSFSKVGTEWRTPCWETGMDGPSPSSFQIQLFTEIYPKFLLPHPWRPQECTPSLEKAEGERPEENKNPLVAPQHGLKKLRTRLKDFKGWLDLGLSVRQGKSANTLKLPSLTPKKELVVQALKSFAIAVGFWRTLDFLSSHALFWHHNRSIFS